MNRFQTICKYCLVSVCSWVRMAFYMHLKVANYSLFLLFFVELIVNESVDNHLSEAPGRWINDKEEESGKKAHKHTTFYVIVIFIWKSNTCSNHSNYKPSTTMQTISHRQNIERNERMKFYHKVYQSYAIRTTFGAQTKKPKPFKIIKFASLHFI